LYLGFVCILGSVDLRVFAIGGEVGFKWSAFPSVWLFRVFSSLVVNRSVRERGLRAKWRKICLYAQSHT
jgi:hypothetical protein